MYGVPHHQRADRVGRNAQGEHCCAEKNSDKVIEQCVILFMTFLMRGPLAAWNYANTPR